jgi:ankyrin repeat protein
MPCCAVCNFEPNNISFISTLLQVVKTDDRMLLLDFQLGVSVDVTDNKGCTPLIVASQYGQTMLAGYLMGKSAQLYLTDREGDTALHWAAFKGIKSSLSNFVSMDLN